jgi:hypothetical protein
MVQHDRCCLLRRCLERDSDIVWVQAFQRVFTDPDNVPGNGARTLALLRGCRPLRKQLVAARPPGHGATRLGPGEHLHRGWRPSVG